MRSQTRLVLVIGLVLFADTMLYAVLAPLLPDLARSLHLTKASAGLLTAAYAIGTLAGSVPAGMLVVRIGPRLTVVIGLALMALSSVAFGWSNSLVVLDITRIVEGVGGACTWAGGLAWVVSVSPPEQRGLLMGQALAAVVVGALFGPVLGVLATAVGRQAVFTGFGVVVALLIPATQTLPRPGRETESRAGLLSSLRHPGVALAFWLVVLPAIGSGAINVLGPLRLHELGASAVVIGGSYLAAAGLEAVISPIVGSVSDRRGRILPLRAGLISGAIVVGLFTVPHSWPGLALLIVISAAAFGLFWAPAMALLSEAAEEHGLHQGMAAALMNIAWAGGSIIGSWPGGVIAKSAGDLAPMLGTSVLCLLTLVGLRRVPGR